MVSAFSHAKSLKTPSHILCLTLGKHNHLYAGSSDASLRLYDLSTYELVRIVQGLGNEVASIAWLETSSTGFGDVWIACGRRVLLIQMDSVDDQSQVQVSWSAQLGEDNEDVLNELSISQNKKFLAFCTDSGTVGVIELSSRAITRMKTRHHSICGSVKFIPARPREIVSGGYDTSLIHFDFMQRCVLSQYTILPHEVVGSMALSPPFIMTTALSPSGIIAAGTADGRLLIGTGGEKRTKGKRSRKWGGLNRDQIVENKLVEAPIVAVLFSDDNNMTISTLLGNITCYQLKGLHKEDKFELETTGMFKTVDMEKVNTMTGTSNDSHIIVGGLNKDGEGIIEVWTR